MHSSASPTTEENDRLDRFISAFNAIDHYLRRKMGENDETPFVKVVTSYEKSNPFWRDGNQLRKYAKLRNVLTHEKTRPKEVLSIPTVGVVVDIEAIQARLIKTLSLSSIGTSDVIVLSLKTQLPDILRLIRQYDFSQFPVYDDNNSFCGLLTENGLTRWLASEYHQTLEMVDFNDWEVSKLLKKEEKRKNSEIISRRVEVDTVIDLFRKNPFLEAILITENGSLKEKPLRIITRWDISRV